MRKMKISETMQNINHKYVDEATAYTGATKATRRSVWMKWGAIAACLCLVIAAVFFGNSTQIVTLDNGDEIKFVKNDGGVRRSDIAFYIDSKELTDGEIKELFDDLPVTGLALFNEEDNSVLGIEGKYADMNIIVSVKGINLVDCVIGDMEIASDVDGVLISAGYYTDGKKVSYYASFDLGNSTVYIENTGVKGEKETVKSDIVSAIQNLIALEQIDLSKIVK
jgi:hypothetical protein